MEEICRYIQKKLPNKWSDEDIIETLIFGNYIYEQQNKEIKAVLVYKELEDGGHHIFFFCCDDKYWMKDLIIQGLKKNIWPIRARRKGKLQFYKQPERLIERLLKYGRCS